MFHEDVNMKTEKKHQHLTIPYETYRENRFCSWPSSWGIVPERWLL